MNSSWSSWKSEIGAVFQKEWRSESRSLSGIMTTALICFVSVIIVNSITWTTTINAMIGAGLYWMILVFAASVSLPRTFLQEEENRTADFWRLVARPEAVYWGKALFNIVQMLVATLIVSILFVIMVKVEVRNYPIFALTGLGGAISIASTATIAGAIASTASNRYVLSAAMSVPLLVFVVNLGITGTAWSFGEILTSGEKTPIAMFAYSIATCLIGPVVYSKIWKS